MEDWQKELINNNRTKLHELTICNNSLVTGLFQRKAIIEEEVQKLVSVLQIIFRYFYFYLILHPRI